MNISYRRRESAPYSETTSSGLTTFPLLLLILWARAIKRILGLSFSTKESPYFLTYKRGKNYEFAWLREKNWKKMMGSKIRAYVFLRYSFLVLLTQCISRVCRYKIPTVVFKCHVFYLPISKLGFKLEKWNLISITKHFTYFPQYDSLVYNTFERFFSGHNANIIKNLERKNSSRSIFKITGKRVM